MKPTICSRTIRHLLRWTILIVACLFCFSPAAPSSFAALNSAQYTGTDLSGWVVVVGDGIYAVPGEDPVNLSDIETMHQGSYSELRANVKVRDIMAHNITYKRIFDPDVLEEPCTGAYQFQLPYQPSLANAALSGETIEGHLSIWDGVVTRREHITAFQWVINPASPRYGDLHSWDSPGAWKKVGYLDPAANWGKWHSVQMMLDMKTGSSILVIDGVVYPSTAVVMTHPEWGTDISVGLAAEIISKYPGDGSGALHYAYFRGWSMVIGPLNLYLPVVQKK